jgi:hypothetical protein
VRESYVGETGKSMKAEQLGGLKQIVDVISRLHSFSQDRENGT